jgi:hypothetical protein
VAQSLPFPFCMKLQALATEPEKNPGYEQYICGRQDLYSTSELALVQCEQQLVKVIFWPPLSHVATLVRQC